MYDADLKRLLAAFLDDAELRASLRRAPCTRGGHHGPDTLPGRRFRFPEALALHRLNAVDSAVKGALEQGLPA